MFGIILKPLRAVIRSSDPTAGRSCAVDFLRGMAILLVLGCHFAVAPAAAGFLAPVAEFWYRVGWSGVDLFFVLSGYLVSGLLFAEYKRNGRVDTGRFLVRRSFKIWPAYFAYLTFVAAWLSWHHRAGAPVGASLWPNWLHVQNYLGTPRVHTWSLAVEEHFYLSGAFLAACLLVRSRFGQVQRWFPTLALAALAVVAVVRYAEFARLGSGAVNLYATHLRFDGLLIGSLVAFLAHFEPARLEWSRRFPVPCVLAGLALAAPALALTPDHSAVIAGPGLTLMYAGFALVVLGVVGLEQGRKWERRLIALSPVRLTARIGFFSYGIYLWHLDLANAPMRKVGELMTYAGAPNAATWLGVTTLYALLAASLGALMSSAIETPCLALRDRLFPSHAGTKKPVSLGVPPEASKPVISAPGIVPAI